MLAAKRIQRDQPKQVQRKPVRDRLKEWTTCAIGVDADAFIHYEARKDEILSANKQYDGDDLQICQSGKREDFKFPEMAASVENPAGDQKKDKRDQPLRRKNAPGFGSVRLAQHIGKSEHQQTEHRPGYRS